MSTTTPEVIIIGGGIGGTAAALSLRGRGVDVRLYEQARHITAVGAGITVGRNGMRVLHRLGLRAAVDAAGAPQVASRFLRPDGTPLGRPAGTPARPHDAARGLHRADLLALLLDALPPGVLRTGHRCVGVDQDAERARVRFADGSADEADAVVGADGIRSAVRPHVVAAGEPAFFGTVAYRSLVPAAEAPGYPAGTVTMWIGDDRNVVAYPVRSGSSITVIGLVPTDPEMGASWSAPGDPDRLRAEFAGWDPRLGDLLARVEHTFRWGLYDRDPLDRWTAGRVTLLGDAAHPMLPFLGQGANQALEDGSALGVLLEDVGPAGVPDALLAYETLRRPHTTAVQGGSRTNGTERLTAAGRDRGLPPGTGTDWIHDYDVEAAAVARRG